MSIGDCPHWPQCGHKSQGACDATGPNDERVPKAREVLIRRCGHRNVDNTSWCPDCTLAEARKSGEFPP